MNYEAVLEEYSMQDILDFNNVDEEDLLKYIVESGWIDLPNNLPVDANDPD